MHFRESHVCSTKLDVQETDIEAEIFSLDAGLRMDGIPALTLWDLVIEVFHSVPNTNRWTRERAMENPLGSCQHTDVIPTNIDHISSNTMPVLLPCCMSLRTMRRKLK